MKSIALTLVLLTHSGDEIVVSERYDSIVQCLNRGADSLREDDLLRRAACMSEDMCAELARDADFVDGNQPPPLLCDPKQESAL